jgi:hypothetical protein
VGSRGGITVATTYLEKKNIVCEIREPVPTSARQLVNLHSIKPTVDPRIYNEIDDHAKGKDRV